MHGDDNALEVALAHEKPESAFAFYGTLGQSPSLDMPAIVLLKIFTSPDHVETDIATRVRDICRRLLRDGKAFESANLAYVALNFYPDNLPLHLVLAEGFVAQGKKDAAIKRYGKVLELDPGSAQAREGLEKARRMP